MQHRRIAASVILVLFAVLHGYTAHAALSSGSSAFYWLGICSVVFAAGYGVATLALWRGWFWARWLGLGIGVVGLLNCLTFAWLSHSGALAAFGSELTWAGLQGVGFAALLALLSGRRMVEAYDESPSPRNHWRYDVRSMRILRWAVVLNIAVLPMLLKHVGNSAFWLSCGSRSVAALTAIALLAGLVLVVMQRTAGLLLLGLGGLSTIYLAGASSCGLAAMLSGGPWSGSSLGYQLALLDTALISTAFLPGALAALAAVAAFAGPITRYLRGR